MSENIESFIEVIKVHSILYDLKHPDYKNICKKDKIWEEIGEKLGIDADHAKKKWKNLRDTYSKYLKTTKTITGQAAKKNYGHWQWATLMEFLKPFLAFAKTVSNITESSINETQLMEINKENDENFLQGSLIEEPSVSENIQPEDSGSISQSRRGRQYKKIKKSDKSEESSESSVKDVIRYLQNKPQKPDMDEIEYLFMGHAKTVKKLSARRQAIVKMKVAQIIPEQELLHLDDLDRTNSPLSYRSPSSI